MEQAHDDIQLRNAGLQRLRSGEYPESVARDLRKQGLSEQAMQSLFASAAAQQRRRGVVRIIAGVILSLVTLFIVMVVSEAGFVIYGPGWLIGLFVLVSGILKLKNSGEIAKAVGTQNRPYES